MKRRHLLGLTAATIWLAAAQGGRGEPAPPPVPKVVMFGDSLTEGFGLPPDQGLVAQLQAWLDRHQVAGKLINAGLSGDTSYGGRIRIGWSLRGAYDAVIVEIGANDLLAGFSLPEIEKNLDVILKRAKRGGKPVLLVGIAPPQSVMHADRAKVQAMWLRLADRHGVALMPDLYEALWQAPLAQFPQYLQADQTHLSAAGVSLVVQSMGPLVAELIHQIKTD